MRIFKINGCFQNVELLKKERGKFVRAGMEWSAEYFGTWKKMRCQTIKLYASFVVKKERNINMVVYAYMYLLIFVGGKTWKYKTKISK